MRQVLIAIVLALASLSSAPALACPMCRSANESAEDPRPKAYMYSILFMLAMPAMLFTGFSVGFYRLSRHIAADIVPPCSDPQRSHSIRGGTSVT